ESLSKSMAIFVTPIACAVERGCPIAGGNRADSVHPTMLIALFPRAVVFGGLGRAPRAYLPHGLPGAGAAVPPCLPVCWHRNGGAQRARPCGWDDGPEP